MIGLASFASRTGKVGRVGDLRPTEAGAPTVGQPDCGSTWASWDTSLYTVSQKHGSYVHAPHFTPPPTPHKRDSETNVLKVVPFKLYGLIRVHGICTYVMCVDYFTKGQCFFSEIVATIVSRNTFEGPLARARQKTTKS